MTDPFSQPVNPMTSQAPTMAQQAQKAQFEALNNKVKEQIIAVFCNPHGLQLLETWEQIYLRAPACPPGCPEGYGYMRSAQNEFVTKIRLAVEQAQQPQGESVQ